MKKLSQLIALLIPILILSCKTETAVKHPKIEVNYAETRKDTTVVDDYHGTQISDPYRWLEDDHSDETEAWVTSQNEVTFGYLGEIPFRNTIKERLEKLWNYERYSIPYKESGKYYYSKNDGLQNQSVIYSMDELGGESKEILDPNKFSEDGTSSLGGTSIDDSGKYLAYGVSEGGSDWRTAYVKNLETGELLSDKVAWIKFSGLSWAGSGFYYSRYPASEEDDKLSQSNEYHSVYYHELGTAQSEDKLIYRDNDNPQRNAYAGTTDDESYLLLYISESTSGNAMKVKDLKDSDSDFVTLVDVFDSDYNVIHHKDGALYVLTNNEAPNQKLIKIDINNPARENWEDVIPESENALRSVSIAGDKMFANYMVDASSKIKIHDMDGTFIQDLELPGIGSASGISGDEGDTEAFYSFTSYIYPTTIFTLNTETLESEVFRKPEVDFDSDMYTTEQAWYTSKDGTKVPMFLTYKKGLKMDGSNPTLLYGYGGFDISILPGFSITRLPILENGGIYAVANIRGGGEFGKKWHKAGTKERKQNVFDDFQAAAEYLIEKNYTSSDKLAIEGGSNGGLLVGACMTQRPDLFKVAFPRVGVLDMLRYHEFTIGWAWATDYGRSDNKEDFDYLIEYSPLHNVKEEAYPATLVTTADHDDRVVPAHSFKFISELQDKHNGENPVLIRIETSAGHGAGKPTSKRIEEAADMLSFMFYNMDENVNFEVKG